MFLKNYHRFLLGTLLTLAVSAVMAVAQQETWTPNLDSRVGMATDKAVSRQSFPIEFKLFNLNIEPFRDQLFTVVDRHGDMQPAIISLPNAQGNIEQFEVWEASNFEPELQAQFPEIRAFSGRGITDKYATLKLSISPRGVQTMVFRNVVDVLGSSEMTEYIEPYSADHTVYAVFGRSRDRGDSPWTCSTQDKNMIASLDAKMPMSARPESNAGQIKTMRLAQSCNGEYANFFGASTAGTPADQALVLAAFNNTLTRANGVYEKDLAIHLNLIANTTAVIYYNPATDPYTTLSSWNAQLQAALTANVGEANYDIGHMFGASGGGGNAGCIGCVCVDGSKGSGITSPADGIPQGDNFDIDYVVHEVGHQMGANHTFSMSLEGTGQNKEVGSGITIMGYAGITAQDVAPHSIATYHATSIDQIQVNMASKTCPVTTNMTVNTPPVVSPVPNATIPISTPFILTGSATDPQGDPITYQWEQNDNSTVSGTASVASPTKATGPNWLSFLPTTSPSRMFPTLATVQAGLFVTGPLPGGDAGANIEALSSVGRTLNFRLTVRDNRPYVAGSTIGQTQFTDTVVTVSAGAGPFKVTSPNTNVSVSGGTSTTVTWDVANTTAAPVSTANVKISFSNDGGVTFPTVLAASTPNDGSESVIIPVGITSTARIKVEAVGNIYFDMSDTNFSVAAPPRARGDFDGDAKTDFSVFRPSGGDWYYQRSTAGFGAAHWGLSSDVPVPGDYDNDAKTDLAVFRADANSANPDFFVLNSATNTVGYFSWGIPGDIPVVGDYDGDAKSDVAVYRPSTETWYILKSSGGTTITTIFGTAVDTPMPGDYDGDQKTDIAYFRQSAGTVFVRPSAGVGTITFALGVASTDLPVPADYSGDKRDEIAFFRPSTGNWFIYNIATNTNQNISFGATGDVPVPGDYDGDGKSDVGVYRNGIWYVNRSTAGFQAISFGLASDIPIPKKYIP